MRNHGIPHRQSLAWSLIRGATLRGLALFLGATRLDNCTVTPHLKLNWLSSRIICVNPHRSQYPQEATMVQLNSPSVDAPQECVHHWLCGDQRNKVVHATCAKCGRETDFVQVQYFEKLAWKRGGVALTLSKTVDGVY
jgi:hypothetical protein